MFAKGHKKENEEKQISEIGEGIATREVQVKPREDNNNEKPKTMADTILREVSIADLPKLTEDMPVRRIHIIPGKMEKVNGIKRPSLEPKLFEIIYKDGSKIVVFDNRRHLFKSLFESNKDH